MLIDSMGNEYKESNKDFPLTKKEVGILKNIMAEKLNYQYA